MDGTWAHTPIYSRAAYTLAAAVLTVGVLQFVICEGDLQPAERVRCSLASIVPSDSGGH